MARPSLRPILAGTLAAGVVLAVTLGAAPRVRARDEAPSMPDAAWWEAQVPITLVLTGGERGALQGADGRGGVRASAALLRRLLQRSRNARGAFLPVAVGWHLRGDASARDRVDAEHWRALFEAAGYVGTLLGGPECAEPASAQPLGGLGELGTPRPPLNVRLASRHLASASPPYLHTQARGNEIRLHTVLDVEDAKRLRDRGEALGDIAPATVFQNLSPVPHRLWLVATWPQGDATFDTLAAAVGRLGPSVLVDVSGQQGRTEADHVELAAGRPPLRLALSPDAVGVLDLVPDAARTTWRATYRRVPLAMGAAWKDDPAAQRAASVLAERVGALRTSRDLAHAPVHPDGEARFVGSSACISCHTAIYKTWKRSPHAGALRTLRDVHADWDRACVACHTVGWARNDTGAWRRAASGFRDPASTGYLGGVGCESCHGPGSRHLMDPWNPEHVAGTRRRAPLTQTQCAVCHDATHDPDFARAFAAAYAAVGHGRVPSDRRTVVPERLLQRLRNAGLAPR